LALRSGLPPWRQSLGAQERFAALEAVSGAQERFAPPWPLAWAPRSGLAAQGRFGQIGGPRIFYPIGINTLIKSIIIICYPN
jgi:hypothetical protein